MKNEFVDLIQDAKDMRENAGALRARYKGLLPKIEEWKRLHQKKPSGGGRGGDVATEAVGQQEPGDVRPFL